MNGLLCTNYQHSRGNWGHCENVWCGPCYIPHPLDHFHLCVPHDESGFEWWHEDYEACYRVGQNGNHLVTVFQCDTCIFINLACWLPLSHSPCNNLTICCIRQANLDSMWGREMSTVRSTAQLVQKTVTLSAGLGIEPEYPALGPFPVSDQLGYGVAVALLLKSLEPG